MDTREIFKPDRNQAIAVVAMLVAVFTFATGELVIGFICFGIAALFSLGGLFWSAHRADRAALLADAPSSVERETNTAAGSHTATRGQASSATDTAPSSTRESQ